MDDSFATAEKRGYAKGYRAGRRKLARAVSYEHKRQRENAFWQRAFVAAIPAFIAERGWEMEGRPVKNLDDFIELAARAADRAVTKSQERGRA